MSMALAGMAMIIYSRFWRSRCKDFSCNQLIKRGAQIGVGESKMLSEKDVKLGKEKQLPFNSIFE